MGRLAKWAVVLLAFVLAVVVVDVGALWVLTHTEWGHEKVKNVAVSGMEKVVHGKTTIARVSGGMLSNVTFEKVLTSVLSGRSAMTRLSLLRRRRM